MLCVSVIGLFVANDKSYASGYDVIVSTELFVPSEITIEPLSLDSEVLYMDSALKLVSENAKDSLRLKNQLSGEFSMEYLPEKTNGSFTAEKFTITFTDAQTQESFSLNLEHGDTTNVYVDVNGEKTGIYYVTGTAQGLTTLCNSVGTYTEIVANKISVKFDPDTMSLYAGAAGEKLSLVWSLSEKEIDGKTFEQKLSAFATYYVDFAVTDISAIKSSGEILIYDINGCKFDNIIMKEAGNTSIYANFEKNALVGNQYKLPDVYVSDLVGGAKKAQVEVAVTDSNGSKISVINGKFTPKTAGEHKITFAYGELAKEYVISAFESEPTYDYDVLFTLSEGYPVNSEIIIPSMSLSGGMLRRGELNATVSVIKDGAVLDGFKNIPSGNAFVFEQVGEYVLRYYIGAGEYVDYQISVNDEKVKFVTEGLLSYYEKGAYIDASTFKVVDQGNDVDFKFSVEYPNGKKYSNEKFVLSEVGVYVLCARYDDGQNVFNLTKKVVVNSKTADFFSYKSTGVEVSHGRSLMTGRSGVRIHFEEADQLINYNLPIDISTHKNIGKISADNVTKISASAKPIIELTIDPKNKGTQAASGVNVYITDAKNPSNMITISTLAQGSTAWSYMRAGATGQSLVGFFNDTTSKTFFYDNTYGYLTGNGTMFYHAVKGGVVSGYTAQDSRIAIYYDSETKQIFTHNARLGKTDIVVDLDDNRFTTAPWSGFESDTVYLSFSLAYVGSTGADITVYSVDGKSFESEDVSYSQAPQIVLENENIVMAGIKGRSFVVPKVSAFDCWGKEISKVITKAYYNSSNGKIDIAVSDGKFKTDKEGTYSIEYIAKDAFGNIGTKSLSIQVYGSYQAISVTPNKSYATEGEVATEISICPAEKVSVVNALGVTEIVRTVYLVENSKKIPIEVSGDSLYVTKPGKYYVEFSVTDGTARTKTNGYFITVESKTDFVVISSLPTFVGFVRGNSYELPEIALIDYSNNNAQETVADVYVDGKLFESSVLSIERGDPEAKDATEKEEYVTIEYKCGSTVIVKYEVPVKTVHKLDVRKLPNGLEVPYTKFMQDRFFISENGANHQITANGIVISTSENNGKISFVQPLASEKLSFVLDVNFEKTFDKNEDGEIIFKDTNIKSFDITLVDANDSNKVLVITFTTNPNTGYVVVSINGTTSQDISASFGGISAEQLSIYYDNANRKIVDMVNGAQILSPATYENGKAFEGFSETVYVSFAFECKEENVPTELVLYSINGQSFSSSVNEDKGAPSITVDGKLNGLFSLGDKITIPTAKALDVFGSVIGNGKFTVSVVLEKETGNVYVKDINGKLLKDVSPSVVYNVVFEAIGNYKIIYYAEDSNGVPKELLFAVTVVHDNKPTFTLNGSMPTKAKLNQKVSVPKATVNYFEQASGNQYYVYVISPSYDIEILKGNNFIAKEEGIYTIRYFALDIYGNYQITDCKIQVSK